MSAQAQGADFLSQRNSRRRNRHSWQTRLKRAFVFLLVATPIGILIASVGAWIYLRPFQMQALEFDLSALQQLETASVIVDRDNEEIGRIFLENRIPISIEEVPKHFIDALLATEDERFMTHDGVDLFAIIRAQIRNFRMRGHRRHGASTLTQQLARAVFLTNENSMDRKFTEIFLARRIETELTKSQILEQYINRVHFGSGYDSLQTASQGYFGKDAKDLTVEECAVLTGLLRAPNGYSPRRNYDRSLERRNYVLDRMAIERYLSKEEAELKKTFPITLAPIQPESRSTYVYEEIRLQLEQLGFDEAATGGLLIETTIDLEMQREAERSLLQHLANVEQREGYNHQTHREYKQIKAAWQAEPDQSSTTPPDPRYLQGAVFAIDNTTGAILALAGGRDFQDSFYNRAFLTRRPPGTAFVPITFAAAFETSDALFPGARLEDTPFPNSRVMIGDITGILGEWGIESLTDNPYRGDISAREAIVHSRNGATVRMGERLGWDPIKSFSDRAGIKTSWTPTNAIFLGQSEMTLADLTVAYSTFPNLGTRPSKTHLIERVTSQDGRVLYQHEPVGQADVTDPITAYQIHSCLTEALLIGTGRPAYEDFGLPRELEAAAKTGTHQGNRDLWVIGYSKGVTCGVWAGFDTPATIYQNAFSREVVLPIWVDVMRSRGLAYEHGVIPPPPSAITAEFCSVSGMLATDFCYSKVQGDDGAHRSIRSTFLEYIAPDTKIVGHCTTHTSDSVPAFDKFRPTFDIIGRNLEGTSHQLGGKAEPIPLLSRIVVGQDPYNALQPLDVNIPERDPEQPSGETAARATLVEPYKLAGEEGTVSIDPPSTLIDEL
jgi:membrane peptidoglycan carboxypeptidase